MKTFRLFEWFGIAGIVFIYGLLMPTQGYSQPQTKVQQITTALQKHFPEVQAKDIQKSSIKGLFEVTRGPTVVYVTEDGRYIISGDIIDINNKFKNITEQSRRSARVNAIKEIQNQDAIVFAPSKVKHTVTVFTDIDCGYCRKFHNEVNMLNEKGISVQYFAFPRSGPDTDSYRKAISVWCSNNQNQALTLAKQGKAVEQNLCDKHNIDKQFQLGV